MRTFESDSTMKDRMLDEAANITAERTAMASAIKAEEIEPREKEISGSGGEMLSLKTPPIPQSPVAGSHAASTKHLVPETIGNIGGGRVAFA